MSEAWQLIDQLEKQFNEERDFIKKVEIKDKILQIKRENGIIKPPDSPYICEGCGS